MTDIAGDNIIGAGAAAVMLTPGIHAAYESGVDALGARPGERLRARGRDGALAQGRILAPIDHPAPAHLVLSGTGLTHVGSAESRDKMHKAAAGAAQTVWAL